MLDKDGRLKFRLALPDNLERKRGDAFGRQIPSPRLRSRLCGSGKLLQNDKAVGLAQRSCVDEGCPSAGGLYSDASGSLVAAPLAAQVAVQPLGRRAQLSLCGARNRAAAFRAVVD